MKYEPKKISKELSNILNKLIKEKRKNIDINQLGIEIKKSVYEFILEKISDYIKLGNVTDVEISFLNDLENVLPNNKVKLLENYVKFKRDKEMDLIWETLINSVDFMINYGSEIIDVLSGYYNQKE
jgi:hypothetical protein